MVSPDAGAPANEVQGARASGAATVAVREGRAELLRRSSLQIAGHAQVTLAPRFRLKPSTGGRWSSASWNYRG
jgi:hypothetical protein